jgi:hypothetical protein
VVTAAHERFYRPALAGVDDAVDGIDWNDLGDPDRVMATRRAREWSAVTA